MHKVSVCRAFTLTFPIFMDYVVLLEDKQDFLVWTFNGALLFIFCHRYKAYWIGRNHFPSNVSRNIARELQPWTSVAEHWITGPTVHTPLSNRDDQTLTELTIRVIQPSSLTNDQAAHRIHKSCKLTCNKQSKTKHIRNQPSRVATHHHTVTQQTTNMWNIWDVRPAQPNLSTTPVSFCG